MHTEEIDIKRAKQIYLNATHTSIIWAMPHPTLSILHAHAYDFKSWCGVEELHYVVAPSQMNGLSKCSRCLRILEENGIEE